MNTRSVGAALVAALALGPAPASAAFITNVIDTFDTAQHVADESGGTGIPSSSEVAAPEAIGGWRDMHVDTAGGGVIATDARVAGGIASFSNISLVAGEGWLTWDGNDGNPLGSGVNTTGLGGVDLVQGANPFFDFDVIALDQNLEFTFRVWDMSGGFSEYFEILPPLENLDATLEFSQFVGDADFNSVGALQIYVNAPAGGSEALDVSISSITVQAVPLPASALLLLGGLGSIAGFKWRRRAA